MQKSIVAFVFIIAAPAVMAQQDAVPPMSPGGGLPSAEQIVAFMDSDKDGFIAKAEAKGPMVQHFDLIDADKDGRVSGQELKTAMAALPPPEPPENDADDGTE